jgi:hypothetical protein
LAINFSSILGRFNAVCEQKFGRTYDFDKLEHYFKEHATGKRHLTAKDVGKLFGTENTPFAKYWPRPHTKALEETLSKEGIYVGPLTSRREALLEKLLSIFHNIGTTSLLLRFVHPEHFGIFSTPVIHLVQVTRPVTIDLYLAYCEELKRWCNHFALPSIAQTETALWTYAQLTKLADTDPEAAKIRQQFDDDMWVQRERAAQVLRPFLRKYGPIQLAQVLLDENPVLAGKIAAEEYERLLTVAALHLRNRRLPREKGAAEGLLEELAAKGFIRPEDKIELQRVWQTRNRVVHPSTKRPEREEVEVMIDCIQRICASWDKHGLRASRSKL